MFSGYLFHSFYYLFFSPLGVTLVSDSGSWLLFLFLIHKLYTTSVLGATITLVVLIPVIPIMSQDGSARSDLPAGG